jgi:hypothetical protein
VNDPTREPYRQTEADRRYRDLLDLLGVVVGEEWGLVCEFDDIVGRRLVEAEDRGARGCER